MKSYKKKDCGYRIQGNVSLCWLGQTNIDKFGYVHCCASSHFGENMLHRAMWVKRNGKIPKGFDLHHKCRTEACCRPLHLELVKHDEHRKHHCKLSKRTIYKIATLYNSGYSLSKIAAKFDVSFAGVRVALIREGLYKPRHSKLSQAEQQAVVLLYKSGYSAEELGRRYKMTGEGIRCFLRKQGVMRKRAAANTL